MEQSVPTNTIQKRKSSDNLTTVISVALFILCSLGIIIFLYNQNQYLKTKLSGYESNPTPTATPISTRTDESPIVSAPIANSVIKSPLKITGAVPAGWMSEGVFPIVILDSNKKMISQGQGKEVEERAWESGKAVEFSATLKFSQSTGSGTIILYNDNPSGNSANSKSFEIPIEFE